MVSPDDLVRIIDFGNAKKIYDMKANQTHDLDCSTRILLKLLERTQTKKKKTEDIQLTKIVSNFTSV